jgi:hypothetical protein
MEAERVTSRRGHQRELRLRFMVSLPADPDTALDG